MPARLVAFLKAMEFTTLTKRVAEAYEADVGAIDADPRLAPGRRRAPPELKALYVGGRCAEDAVPGGDADAARPAPTGPRHRRRSRWLSRPISPPRARTRRSRRSTARPTRRVRDARAARRMDRRGPRGRASSRFDTETTSLDAMQADLVGVSLAVAPGRACYIPLQHRGEADLFGGGLLPGQIPLAQARRAR